MKQYQWVYVLFYTHCNISFTENMIEYLDNYDETLNYNKWISFFMSNINNLYYSPINSKSSGIQNDISSITNISTRYTGHNLFKIKIN